MTLKPGASVDKMTHEMILACQIIDGCYEHFGVECLLTSGDEATTKHVGIPVAGDTVDPHYLGKAADFRIWTVPTARRQMLVDMIEERLGVDFYVEWEGQGTPNEHLHIQHGHVVP